ncbi:MAG: bifunctional diguanylate cyclase/phosphodiesterase [Clostridium sp.]
MKNIETEDIIAYAYVKDIDKEKKRQLKLQYMAERDLLTGLYNKEITGKLVKEHLSGTQDSIESALFMIDVDDFKNINDHFGHVYGDAVLCEFGEKLGRAFRCDDIVGRIGGDEFIAYIKSGASEKIVREKAEEILKAVMITYKDSQGVEYSISSSIGVAMVPKDGRSFEEIYQHADTALYMAKCGGKDRYQLYDGSTFIGYESGRKETQTDETVSPKTFRQNRIEYVFKILYQSENPVEAIHAVLELIAGHFSFERGYIFETSKDGKTTSNTFEWCAIGITPERNNLQNVSIDVVSTANSSFYKTGTYIVKSLDDLNAVERTILKPQGIKSMFQFGIFDKRKLLGFIGFDNCINQALPNNTDIDEIKTICNILATFFVKQHNDEIAAQDLQVRQSVMNHLKNLVYVVNPQTFEVLFMNDQARKLVGVVKYDSPCYQLFRGKTKQCDDCPIKSLNDSPAYQMYCEIYNDKFKVWAEATASTLPWTDGSQAYLIESADITKQKEEHLRHIEQLEKLAFVDELTGCRTYYKFKEDAQGILMRQQDMSHVLIKFDIDNFRLINQIYGYEKGDEVLRNVVKAMERIMRDKDEIFARVSNDEFVALLSMRDNTTIETLHEHFLSNFNDLMEDDFSFKCTFPHGLCTVEPGEIAKIDIKDLFEKANFAHKMAKQNKDDQFVVYDESMTKKALCMKEIENKMSEALQNNEFEIYLQPKYYLDTELVGGAEALSRWRNENPELFFPNVFIPVFERNGFITKLDFYVLRKTCTVIKNWLAMGIKPVTVSVNFSRLHLNNCNFVKELCEVVDSIEIDRKYIEVEITETAIYENMDALEALLIELHANGFAMSMDDFGSGYSSLGLLKNLPVDTIKMDRSFFANQKDTVRSKIVVGSIIEMAAGLGIHIVAEGVEEQQYIDLLRGLHCDMVQGYYYSRPMSVEDFTELIRKPVEFSSARSSYFA